MADETEDHATVSRCMRQPMEPFAWISPYRNDIYRVADPVGPDTDAEVLDVCRDAPGVIRGCGNEGAHCRRGAQMQALLRAHGVRRVALAFNKNGAPNTLYFTYDAPLLPLPE